MDFVIDWNDIFFILLDYGIILFRFLNFKNFHYDQLRLIDTIFKIDLPSIFVTDLIIKCQQTTLTEMNRVDRTVTIYIFNFLYLKKK